MHLRLTLVSFLLVFASTLTAADKNIVVFVVDDQGRDAGCYGNKVIQTPNLDRLAAEGTRFDFAFCTTASCSASRSVILTGLQNHLNGQFGHQHSYHNFHTKTSVKSLPVLLSRAGYRTARIGKYHVQPESVYQFDQHLQGNPGASRNPVSMAKLASSFITEKSDKPFFLYFCTSDPHRGGGIWRNKPHRPDRFGNRPAAQQYRGVESNKTAADKVIVPPYLPESPECRAELSEYYESVNRIDQGLGVLVQTLKEAKLWDSTLILYLSDNGIAFPGAKTTLYEPGMRLPLIVRSPDQSKRGHVTDAMVNWTDLTPTCLDYAGATPKGYKFHGRSFLDVLSVEKSKGWDRVHASHTFHEITMYYPMRVLRERKYKLIFNVAHQLPYPFASDLYASATWQGIVKRKSTHYGKREVSKYLQRDRFELYDLESDPHEVHNLAGNPAHAKTLKRMQRELESWQRATKDPWVVKYKYE